MVYWHRASLEAGKSARRLQVVFIVSYRRQQCITDVMAGPSHNLFLDGSGGAIGEGMHDDQHFVNLNELELIGMPFNAPRDYAYSDNGMTPRTQDSLDRLLDNCQFNFCPLLQAKMTAR